VQTRSFERRSNVPIAKAINVGQPGRTTLSSVVQNGTKETREDIVIDKRNEEEVEPQDSKVGVQDEQDEIEQQDAAELPDREAMSLINANLAAPINAAVAANVLSDNSVAYANAEQNAPIVQGNNSDLTIDDPNPAGS
jgi:hypothetical protein